MLRPMIVPSSTLSAAKRSWCRAACNRGSSFRSGPSSWAISSPVKFFLGWSGGGMCHHSSKHHRAERVDRRVENTKRGKIESCCTFRQHHRARQTGSRQRFCAISLAAMPRAHYQKDVTERRKPQIDFRQPRMTLLREKATHKSHENLSAVSPEERSDGMKTPERKRS